MSNCSSSINSDLVLGVLCITMILLCFIFLTCLGKYCCCSDGSANNSEENRIFRFVPRDLLFGHLSRDNERQPVDGYFSYESEGEIYQSIEMTLNRVNPLNEQNENPNENPDSSKKIPTNANIIESVRDQRKVADPLSLYRYSSSESSVDSISLDVNVNSSDVSGEDIFDRHYHIHCQEHSSGAVSVDVFYSEHTCNSTPKSLASPPETTRESLPFRTHNSTVSWLPENEILNNYHFVAANKLLEELQNRLISAQISVTEERNGSLPQLSEKYFLPFDRRNIIETEV